MATKIYTVSVQLGGTAPTEAEQAQLLAHFVEMVENYKSCVGTSDLAVVSVVDQGEV